MIRRRAGSVSVAVLFVVVVGLAAGTIQSTRGGSDGGIVRPERADVVGGGGSAAVPSLPFVGLVLALLVVVLVVAGLRYHRELAAQTAGLTAVGLLYVGIYRFLVVSGEVNRQAEIQEAGRTMLRSAEVALTEPGAAEGPSATSPALLLAVGIVVLLVLGAVVGYWSDVEGALALAADEEDDDALAAVGQTAGKAADRLQGADADVDNEVYRAWDEMRGHLDVDDGGSRTPGEFRTAALDAGMAREDVDGLTELFEEVRYGGAAPTGARERDAAAALRRIEQAYAAGEAAA